MHKFKLSEGERDAERQTANDLLKCSQLTQSMLRSFGTLLVPDVSLEFYRAQVTYLDGTPLLLAGLLSTGPIGIPSTKDGNANDEIGAGKSSSMVFSLQAVTLRIAWAITWAV